jgi:integrase
MAGSMRQRGRDTWQLRVYIGVDLGNGRERYATRTVHGTRRAATTAMAELVEQAGQARLRAGTIADLLERWFAAASPGWSASTVRETRSLLRCHLIPQLGHLPVTKVDTQDIDDLYAHLLRTGKRDHTPLAPGTVHRVHVVLHRALAQAVRWGWIFLNPATQASPPPVEPADIRPPSPRDVAVLLSSVASYDLALCTYLRLAAITGARRSQLLALRWSDVDLDHTAISYTRALVEGPHGPVLRPTKNHRTYRVALDNDTLRAIENHHTRCRQSAAGIGAELTSGCFVFSPAADSSRPWAPNSLTKRFIAARQRAGLPHFRLHDLRHFMATQMLAAGTPIATVSGRLGHARASTTLNIYAHTVPGADHHAVQRLATTLTNAH